MTSAPFSVKFQPMKNAGYTRQERSFIALMRVLAIIFFGGAILFAAMPDYLPAYLTKVGNGLFGWESAPFPPAGEMFWVVQAVAFLLVLSYLCVVVQRNIVRNIGYTRPVILAALVSFAGFSACFFFCERHFVYFVAAVVDGAVGIITWRFYHRAHKSRA